MKDSGETISRNKSTIIKAAVALPVVAGAIFAGYKLRELVAEQDAKATGGADRQDDSAARNFDRALIQWRQAEEIETGVGHIESIARVGETHVAVVGGKTLRILPRTGGAAVTVALADSAKAVAWAGDKLYVGVRDHVEVYNLGGSKVAAWPSFGQGAIISAITAHGENFYVADAGQRVVYRLDAGGGILAKLGQKDEAKHSPGLVLPSPHLDVQVAADGMVWINNPGLHQLQGFDGDGVMVRRWGDRGMAIQRFAGCCNPTDFALFADGRFVTAEKGVPRVKVYSASGEFINVVAGPETFGPDASGMDVSVDEGGRVWVADPRRGVIRIFSGIEAAASQTAAN